MIVRIPPEPNLLYAHVIVCPGGIVEKQSCSSFHSIQLLRSTARAVACQEVTLAMLYFAVRNDFTN